MYIYIYIDVSIYICIYVDTYIYIYIYVPRAIYNYEEVCLYIHQYVTTLWHKDRDLIWLEEEMFLSNKNIVGYLHARTHMYIYIYIVYVYVCASFSPVESRLLLFSSNSDFHLFNFGKTNLTNKQKLKRCELSVENLRYVF